MAKPEGGNSAASLHTPIEDSSEALLPTRRYLDDVLQHRSPAQRRTLDPQELATQHQVAQSNDPHRPARVVPACIFLAHRHVHEDPPAQHVHTRQAMSQPLEVHRFENDHGHGARALSVHHGHPADPRPADPDHPPCGAPMKSMPDSPPPAPWDGPLRSPPQTWSAQAASVRSGLQASRATGAGRQPE